MMFIIITKKPHKQKYCICGFLCHIGVINYSTIVESTAIVPTESRESTTAESTAVELETSDDCTLLPQEAKLIAAIAKAKNKIFFITF